MDKESDQKLLPCGAWLSAVYVRDGWPINPGVEEVPTRYTSPREVFANMPYARCFDGIYLYLMGVSKCAR